MSVRSQASDEWDALARVAQMDLKHPARWYVVRHLFEHGEASTKEMHAANSCGIGLENYAYHVRMLRDAGIVRPVRRRARRGAIETFYVLTASARRALEAIVKTPPAGRAAATLRPVDTVRG